MLDDFIVFRYLSDKGLFSAELYPKDLQSRARVDEFLEWHHLTLRAGCAIYFLRCWLMPINGLAHMPSQDSINKLIKEMENSLKLVEKIWLKDSEFVSGNKLTIADLMGASEIEQTSKLYVHKCIALDHNKSINPNLKPFCISKIIFI